jgi:peroxiredoxin-like protein
MDHVYRVTVEGTGEKTGILTSEVPIPALAVGSPPQFGGSGEVWSPEHLFVAAVASCLMTTFRAIATASGLEVVEYSDSAEGVLAREGSLFRVAEITVRPTVVITDPDQADKALRLLQKAETACMISRSVNSTVHMQPEIKVALPQRA